VLVIVPVRVIVTRIVFSGVQEYQTDWYPVHTSPVSLVASEISTVVMEGVSPVSAIALPKLSLDGAAAHSVRGSSKLSRDRAFFLSVCM